MKARYDYTAPPAKHGRTHLFLALILSLLLGGWLSSCAPARLPLGPVAKHAEPDSRTRRVEPYLQKAPR